jgi:hypothetical protein
MNKPIDYHTRRRQLWIARQSHDFLRFVSTLFSARNQRGIDLEELAYKVSDRAAAVVVAVMIWGIFEYVQ